MNFGDLKHSRKATDFILRKAVRTGTMSVNMYTLFPSGQLSVPAEQYVCEVGVDGSDSSSTKSDGSLVANCSRRGNSGCFLAFVPDEAEVVVVN